MFGRSRLLLIYRDNYNLSRSVSPILRPRFFSRLNQGPRETEVISKEDLGCLPVSLLPSSYTWIASVSSNPTKILSALYHRFIVSSLHLRSFRKVIRPDTLSVKLLTDHAKAIAITVADAYKTGDIRQIRSLCGMQLQSALIRAIKKKSNEDQDQDESILLLRSSAPTSNRNAYLISFVQQAVNIERTQMYAQAVVRIYSAQDKRASDVFLTSRTWIRPVRWTIEKIQ